MFYWTKDECWVLPLTLAIIIAITITLYFTLRKKSDKIRAIPLQVIAVIILILEVFKQSISIRDGYSFWTIPLHYCSLFLFFIPLAQLTRERTRNFIKPVAFSAASAMTLLFYVNPSSIIGSSASDMFISFSKFHTFTFHHLVILYLLLSIVLRNYTPKWKHFISVLIVMTIYFAIGMTAAHLLDTNYCNFLTSNIPFMESLRLKTGQVFYSIAMFFFITGGTALLNFIYFLIYKLFTRKKKA